MKPDWNKNEVIRNLIEERDNLLKNRRTIDATISRLNRGIRSIRDLEGVTVRDDKLPLLKSGRRMRTREVLGAMAPGKEMYVCDIADALMGQYTEPQIIACMKNLFNRGKVDHISPSVWKLKETKRGT